ncbi:MAG TPA: FAD-binding oxidoreductase [Solirubrobacteraceae bacterium]|nr:FAD-binding oxidoreductase [Solirubrobacteraceae bacterium]
MTGPDPTEFGWWLASRAAGIVALICITVSVGVGLAMAGRVSRRPALARTLLDVHQQTALVGLVAIAVHGITLLGDRFLSPSIGDITIPFTSAHEPLWTGLGVAGGWLAAILGLSYWVRHRIGAGLWRKLHRATVLVYVLAVAHTLGAGTDASAPWMRVLLIGTGAPILFLFVMRVFVPRPGPRFVRYRVADVRPESRAVCSFELVPAGRRRIASAQAGQFVTVRAEVPAVGRTLRSYSLSRPPDRGRLRISVKREPDGIMSRHLHGSLDVGSIVELAGPSGAFVLGAERCRPIVLISAGIGVTPVLAMLHAVAERHSQRELWWIHGARNGREHPFRGEARALLGRLERARSHVRYSRPEPVDVLGRDFDAEGRLAPEALLDLGVPLDAEFRLCGAPAFVHDLADGLRRAGVRPADIRSESFGGAPATPAPATSRNEDGPSVVFARSSVAASWDGAHATLLELAEAHAVPASPGCRVGACHGCRATVLDGAVRHEPEPLEPPPPGSALLCCARPEGDVVLDV